VTEHAGGLRASCRLYVATVSVVGVAVASWCAWALWQHSVPKESLVFVLLILVAGRLTLTVPSVDASFSISEVIGFTTVMLFGWEVGALTLAIDSLILSSLHRMSAQKAAFNFGNLALAASVSGMLFFALIGTPPLYGHSGAPDRLVLPLAVMVSSYFAINSGLLAIALALQTGERTWRLWRDHFMWLGLGYGAAGSIAVLLVVALRQVHFSALVVLPPVVIVAYLMLRSSFGRLEDAKRHVERLNRLCLSTIESLAAAIDAKDETTHGHVRRVQGAAVALARELGLTDEQMVKALEAAALLHDTGKIAIPEHILNKPGRLTPAEFEQMKLHAPIGAEILSSIEFPYPVVPIVRHHHESWDGSGYPDGLVGTDIPIGARILAVVDCFDALTSDRPYRRRMTDQDALQIVIERRGTMYDPLVVDTFARAYQRIMPPAEVATHPAARAVRGVREPPAAAPPAPALPESPVPEDVLAFTSLARAAHGNAGVGDLGVLVWMLVRHVVPCNGIAIFAYDVQSHVMIARCAAGPYASRLRRLRCPMGQGPVGWAAVNTRVVVNAPSIVDGPDTSDPAPLNWTLTVPLVSDGQPIAVLALYADAPFMEDHARVVELLSPHLVASFAAVEARHESAAPVDSLPVRQAFELKILRGGLPSGSPVDARTG
jgi:putative nucleotidyltransferase with HDIG domain